MSSPDINEEVSLEAIVALRRFAFENYRVRFAVEGPTSDSEMRSLLMTAARAATGDRGLPRTLEALRCIYLVPEDVGAALFERSEKP